MSAFSKQQLTQAIEAALQDAYQRGWDDATAAVLQAASSRHPNVSKGLATGQTQNDQRRIGMSELRNRVTAREAVTQALKVKPGMQSKEIFHWIEASGLSVSFEAVRTAITRLRRARKVVRFGDGYALWS